MNERPFAFTTLKVVVKLQVNYVSINNKQTLLFLRKRNTEGIGTIWLFKKRIVIKIKNIDYSNNY